MNEFFFRNDAIEWRNDKSSCRCGEESNWKVIEAAVAVAVAAVAVVRAAGLEFEFEFGFGFELVRRAS